MILLPLDYLYYIKPDIYFSQDAPVHYLVATKLIIFIEYR